MLLEIATNLLMSRTSRLLQFSLLHGYFFIYCTVSNQFTVVTVSIEFDSSSRPVYPRRCKYFLEKCASRGGPSKEKLEKRETKEMKRANNTPHPGALLSPISQNKLIKSGKWICKFSYNLQSLKVQIFTGWTQRFDLRPGLLGVVLLATCTTIH